MYPLEAAGTFPLPLGRARAASTRVGLLVDSSSVGGIERHIEVLAGALRDRGIDARVTLLANHGSNPWLGQLKAADVPFEINSGGMAGLYARLRKQRVSLLHTHGYKAGIVGRVIARVLSLPVVSTFHAGEIGPFPVNLYQRVDEWTSALGRRISVSPAIAARLPFPSRVIANFVSCPAEPAMSALPPAIGFVGRLSHEKGPDLFCQAALRFSGCAEWRMYGDGPMRRDLESAFGRRVEFRGFVGNMAAAWPEIGLLLMPSRAEGLPMAALEALASGVPVAAARVGALPEVIRHGENGWLFESGDMSAIQEIIDGWSRDRAARGPVWRRAAWRSVRDRFSIEAGLDATLQSYCEAGLKL